MHQSWSNPRGLVDVSIHLIRVIMDSWACGLDRGSVDAGFVHSWIRVLVDSWFVRGVARWGKRWRLCFYPGGALLLAACGWLRNSDLFNAQTQSSPPGGDGAEENGETAKTGGSGEEAQTCMNANHG